MLDAIGDADNVEKWLTNALDHGERLMGFGHRVYKAEDPRAEILREMAETASDPEFFELSKSTEEKALQMLNERKPGRRLYTNVEFYSAAVLAAVGLPGDMFTPTFAVSRSVGWSAHVLEQVSEQPSDPPAVPIRRPNRQEVLGHREPIAHVSRRWGRQSGRPRFRVRWPARDPRPWRIVRIRQVRRIGRFGDFGCRADTVDFSQQTEFVIGSNRVHPDSSFSPRREGI